MVVHCTGSKTTNLCRWDSQLKKFVWQIWTFLSCQEVDCPTFLHLVVNSVGLKGKHWKLCTNLNPTVTDRKQLLFLKVERSFAQFMLYPMGWFWDLLYQWGGWMYSMMLSSSSVAVRTPTNTVFQPQTILPALVEEYFPNNFYFRG